MFNMSNFHKFEAIGLYSNRTTRAIKDYLSDLSKGSRFAPVRLLNIDDTDLREEFQRTRRSSLIRTRLFQQFPQN